MRSPPTSSRRSSRPKCGTASRPRRCGGTSTRARRRVSDLQELYQSIILDHNRRPKNYGALEGANHRAEGRNPDCGDEVTVELVMTGDRIDDVRFTSAGCAVSRAAASIMTQSVKGKSRAEVEQLFAR